MLRLGLIIAAAVLIADQASKYWVLEGLNFSPTGCREFGFRCGKIEISPIFDLTMLWNDGISFGLLRAGSEGARWALVLLQGGIACLFGWWLLSARAPMTGWALGLVIGGALGNVLDRIRFGAVVDFLDFSGLGFPWVFNVADAAINVGAVLLAIEFLILRRETKLRAAAEPAPRSDAAS